MSVEGFVLIYQIKLSIKGEMPRRLTTGVTLREERGGGSRRGVWITEGVLSDYVENESTWEAPAYVYYSLYHRGP